MFLFHSFKNHSLETHSFTSGCLYQDGIIKLFTTIRADMTSMPISEDQQFYLRQALLCRGCNIFLLLVTTRPAYSYNSTSAY